VERSTFAPAIGIEYKQQDAKENILFPRSGWIL
jgi:hypothetical protein